MNSTFFNIQNSILKNLCGRSVMVGESFAVPISPTGFSATVIGFKNDSETCNYFGDSFP